ncbi:MAG: hypothetical protein II630_09030, partial [Bacteroidales bacterium]|nr:hypothetical protein [Bacteroidales bacterium]
QSNNFADRLSGLLLDRYSASLFAFIICFSQLPLGQRQSALSIPLKKSAGWKNSGNVPVVAADLEGMGVDCFCKILCLKFCTF